LIKLNITVSGKGPNLVLIHGWAMSSQVWKDWLPVLEKHYRVFCVDLPGHGGCTYDQPWSMDDVLASLADQLPSKSSVLGWSLGGMVALAYANKCPQNVERIVMLASSAKFVQSNDWQHAQMDETLTAFTAGLLNNAASTTKRFLMLQTQGMAEPKKISMLLRRIMSEAPAVQKEALISGLAILANADLRQALKAVTCPLLMLMGSEDQLIPLGVANDSRKINSNVESCVIEGASHVPFLSHQEHVDNATEQFLSATGSC